MSHFLESYRELKISGWLNFFLLPLIEPERPDPEERTPSVKSVLMPPFDDCS